MIVIIQVEKVKIDLARAAILLQPLKYNFAELTTRTVFENDLGLFLGLHNDFL